MKHILLYDTSVGTDNVGDEIIMDYCKQQILGMFNEKLFFMDRVPTHLEIGKKSHNLNRNAEYRFVCGTNILKTSMLRKKGWKIGLKDSISIKELCLMGVGWGGYNSFSTDPYTKFIYKTILSKKKIHSVRDNYTKAMLEKIGIHNVIVTACPTMWNLTAEFCKQISKEKSKDVITALTYYKPDKEHDCKVLSLLADNYETVYLWLQQADDYEYFHSLKTNVKVKFINPQLAAYDDLLIRNDVDYIGSRLHGGIRALNHKRRSLILAVDNRAAEIHKDTNLPVVDRIDISSISRWIVGGTKTEINLPIENISAWKCQFDI